MKNYFNDLILYDREEMTEDEKQLYLADIKQVCCDYFDGDERYSLDVTKTDTGFSVCIIFDARRVKRFKKPL
jgi:hypothetical protein